MGLIKNYKALRSLAQQAGYGKATSRAVRSAPSSGRSSGAMSAMKNNKMAQMVARNPGKSAIAGGAVLGGVAMGRTRRSGLDKTSGRPTGMYGY